MQLAEDDGDGTSAPGDQTRKSIYTQQRKGNVILLVLTGGKALYCFVQGFRPLPQLRRKRLLTQSRLKPFGAKHGVLRRPRFGDPVGIQQK